MSTTDPSRNIVVFVRGENPDDAVMAMTLAQQDDAVQQAWRQVTAEEETDEAAQGLVESTQDATVLPVLRSASLPGSEFAQQLVDAIMAVSEGLVVEGLMSDDDELMQLRRKDGFNAAAAILLPDFHKWLSDIRGWQELIVAITRPDFMLVAPGGWAAAEKLRQAVQDAEQEAPELRPPCCASPPKAPSSSWRAPPSAAASP